MAQCSRLPRANFPGGHALQTAAPAPLTPLPLLMPLGGGGAKWPGAQRWQLTGPAAPPIPNNTISKHFCFGEKRPGGHTRHKGELFGSGWYLPAGQHLQSSSLADAPVPASMKRPAGQRCAGVVPTTSSAQGNMCAGSASRAENPMCAESVESSLNCSP